MFVQRTKSGRKYAYYAVRTGKQVSRRYLGSAADPVVAAVTRLEELSQAEKAAQRRAVLDEATVLAGAAAVISLISRWSKRLLWRHHDRQRKNGAVKPTRITTKGISMKVSAKDTPTPSIPKDDFDDIARRAMAGDAGALAELRQVLRENPLVFGQLGDLSGMVQQALLESIRARSPVAALALEAGFSDRRQELHRWSQSPLVRLLSDLLLTTQLDLALHQIGLAQSKRRADIRHWEQRVGRAQQRHIDAVLALAALQGTPVEDPSP